MGVEIIKSCIYCGEQVRGSRMHLGCLIDDIYDTIASGKELTPAQRERCKVRHIRISDIRRAVIQDACGKIDTEEKMKRIELIEE